MGCNTLLLFHLHLNTCLFILLQYTAQIPFKRMHVIPFKVLYALTQTTVSNCNSNLIAKVFVRKIVFLFYMF